MPSSLTRLQSLGENVAAAVESMRQAKGRSALTVLGVVIGVSTVMAMAAIVRGVQQQIVHTIEIAGPTTFYVMKVFSQTPLNPDNLPAWVRIRPDLREEEAQRIAALPEIRYAAIWGQILNRVEYAGVRTNVGVVMGADDGYPEIYGGELTSGRWFTAAELRSGEGVVVLDADAAAKLFGAVQPIDKWVRVGGRSARVIGVYQAAKNIFEPPGQKVHAIVSYRMLDRQFAIDKTNALFIPVKPRPGVTVADAQGAVTVALRELRRLHPADRSTFDFITQEQILDTFNKITGVFFLVMIVLSSVGLMVGGIGVMAVMMISVTDRTREIGIRKACGATRGDIMLQFLTEASTLTGIGGAIGIVVGLLVGRVANSAMKIQASPPVNLTLLAVGVSVGIGLVFGLLPARRAARLDPIEALRYE
ncbi:MacB-like periplasmic core domain protein [Gemmatirosa kalamazoonensis]|uniref:MacB-like periplasmic core domain protein n=1 Tax=Gemmatirosa kalamazoonensis TaxID=861299 RepID=W0RDR8_9BACT|nr:ABC transporter permease [Gemmatirosa kalamazoonensis]AHG88951.1 MacB-like periplasmic core domain protein [Gemmatirosa kalamazoonensis]